MGFWGDDVEITIDMAEKKSIKTIKTRFYNAQGQWIYAPKKMSVSGIDKGKDVLLGAILIDSGANNTIINAEIDLTPLEELEHRYIKISIPNKVIYTSCFLKILLY